MPTIYANINDTGVASSKAQDGDAGWEAARNGNNLTLFGGSDPRNPSEIAEVRTSVTTNVRPATWRIIRHFLEFDFTGVSNVASATLYLTRAQSSSPTSRARLIKGPDQSPAITSFTSIPGFVQGSSMAGNVTDYSSDITTGGEVETEISFSLNTTCINDLNVRDTLNLAMVDYDADYLNDRGNVNSVISFFIVEEPGVVRDPRIEYTIAERSIQTSKTKSTLRERSLINLQLEQDTDYEFKFRNTSNNQVYFTLEGAKGKNIFESCSIRTTTSDSGSNVLNVVSGSTNASMILEGAATSSFMVSSSTDTIVGNNIKAIATNALVYNINDSQASGSVFGVDMEIIK